MDSWGRFFVWTSERQDAFEALKSCLFPAPILAFSTESDRVVLDTDASLFVVGGILNQIQGYREVVIAYASRSLRLSRNVGRRYNVSPFLGCSVYSAHRPPVPPVASKVLQQQRYASPLVHASQTVLTYLGIPAGVSAR